MINANELRLGNWIQDFGDGYGQVLTIDKDDLVISCNNLLLPLANFQPIELTPELLEKIGCEKHDIPNGIDFIIQIMDGFYFDFRFLKAAKEWKEFLLVGNGGYDEAGELNIEERCKYLHQLQNLFYSLTGKELEISL